MDIFRGPYKWPDKWGPGVINPINDINGDIIVVFHLNVLKGPAWY